MERKDRADRSIAWTRDEIAERVDELHEEHEGKSFADAVSRFARESLNAREQKVLRAILLERAAEETARNKALAERIEKGGWFRRWLRRTERRAPR